MTTGSRRWLSRWLGVDTDEGGAEGFDPLISGPMTIEEFETLRDESPPELEVLSGSTAWIDGRECITALIVGERDSNEVIAVGCPPDGGGWREFDAESERAARGKLAEAVASWNKADY